VGPNGGGSSGFLPADGTVTWHIPLAVSVKLGERSAGPAAGPSVKSEPAMLLPPPQPRSEARLELDENYKDRSGYDPSFLPGFVVPLPKLSREIVGSAAVNQEAARGDDPRELKYEHFSVVMNGKRRLAFFTATNIDGKLAKDVDRTSGAVTDASGVPDGEEEGLGAEAAEEWLKDRRIKDKEQTPPDLFAGQWTFDDTGRRITDRRTNEHRNRMFQQGHLTRRQDPLWGTEDAALRANTDTFHVTNRAPQVGYFNMGMRKRGSEARGHPGGTLHWRALEDFVLLNARADRDRVTVFTGPIFDDDNDFPWSRGRDDLKGFKAPREFWKLVLRVEGGALHATALVADQSPLIDFLPEMLEVSGEEARRIAFDKVAKYQVSVAELANRTKLDFGSAVRGADTFAGGGERAKSKRVSEFSDLIVGLPTKPQRAAAARATDASRRSSASRGKKKRGAGVRRKR
jgi:endonuclease G